MPVRARENPPVPPRARERAPGAGVFFSHAHATGRNLLHGCC